MGKENDSPWAFQCHLCRVRGTCGRASPTRGRTWASLCSSVHPSAGVSRMSTLSSQSLSSPGGTPFPAAPVEHLHQGFLQVEAGGRTVLREGSCVCSAMSTVGGWGTSRLGWSQNPELEALNPGYGACIHPLSVQQSLICSINQGWLQFNFALFMRTFAKQIISINGILNV